MARWRFWRRSRRARPAAPLGGGDVGTTTTSSGGWSVDSTGIHDSGGPPRIQQRVDLYSQTTDELRLATARLSGRGFQSLAPRVAALVARRCDSDDPEWTSVSAEIQELEENGWELSRAAEMLRTGVRDRSDIVTGVDSHSQVLCEYLRRLVRDLESRATDNDNDTYPRPTTPRRITTAEQIDRAIALSLADMPRPPDPPTGGSSSPSPRSSPPSPLPTHSAPQAPLVQSRVNTAEQNAIDRAISSSLVDMYMSGNVGGEEEGTAPASAWVPPSDPPISARRLTSGEQSRRRMEQGLTIGLSAMCLVDDNCENESDRSREREERAMVLTTDCPICFDNGGHAFRLGGTCAHEMHRTCAVAVLRAALGNARSQIFPMGMRCPCLSASGEPCCEFLTVSDCARLVSDIVENARDASSSRPQGRIRGGTTDDERNLHPDEFECFTGFVLEATVPDNEKLYCPSCERMILLEEAGELPEEDIQCPYCDNEWDPSAAAGQDDATRRYLEATSKCCPNCGIRSTHYHGHECHHIGYGTNGCPQCHQHWCYVCLRKHGTPQGDGTPTAFTSMADSRNPDCPHGSSFCDLRGIADHIVNDPVPHDSRCGCPICPTCRPPARGAWSQTNRGRPCAQCCGACVVCRGIVPPGPAELPN